MFLPFKKNENRENFFKHKNWSFFIPSPAQAEYDRKEKRPCMEHHNLRVLLSQLSLEEKIGQTNMLGGSIYSDFSPEQQEHLLQKGQIGSMMYLDAATNNKMQKRQLASSPHALPIIFCGDIIHGLRTIFPCPLGEAASFDPTLAREAARIAAKEGSALGGRWTFAPMSDIARDARWGRNIEGAGEDPYLASEFTKARVAGFQGEGKSIDPDHLAATIKHFAGYSYVDGGCEYERVIASKHELETYSYPVYAAGIKAGASTVMAAFNDIDGIPCTANKALLKDYLRGTLGFKGVVVSDYGAVGQLVNARYAASPKEAVYEAFSAGNDIDMESRLYTRYLPELIQEGRIPLPELDETVLRILELKEKVGLFDQPLADESRLSKDVMTPEALALAEKEAIRAAVLLKNEGVLPLQEESVVGAMGPLFDSAIDQNGPWSYDNTLSSSITYKTALKKAFPNLREGKAPLVLYFGGLRRHEGGEAASKANLDLPLEQKQEIRQLVAEGTKVILIVTSARVLSLSEEAVSCAGILMMWAPGMMGGSALAKLLLGLEEPTGHLPMSFPRMASQCPVYYNGFANPRPYSPNDYYTSKWIDAPYGPLYPFGYGLSYQPWALSEFAKKKDIYRSGEDIAVSCTIENLGNQPVRRLIQIYAHKAFHQPLWPQKELVLFQWVNLGANESKTVPLFIPSLRLRKGGSNWGEYTLFLGYDSADIVGRLQIEIKR